MLFLYSRNIKEYPETALLAPIVISFIFAAVVFCITRVFLRSFAAAAPVSAVLLFIFLSYGRFLELYKNSSLHLGGITLSHYILVFAASVFLLFSIVVIILRSKKHLLKINQLFFFLSLLLLFFPLSSIVSFEAKTGRIFTIELFPAAPQKNTTQSIKGSPDIYYFIFDRYAGPKSAKNEYNIDNRAFFDFLKKKEFYLAEGSSTNYPRTFLSLGSSLNMEYLDSLTEKTKGGESGDETLVTPLIRNNKVLTFLKEKGYYTVNIGPKTWGPTSKNPYADESVVLQNSTYPYADAFTTGFLNTTFAAPLLKQLFHNPIDVSVDPDNNEHRKLILFQLDAVEKAIAIKSPKFVFAHILIPHDPFVFDKNCNPIPETVVEKNDHVTNYKNQLACANKKIEALLTKILAESKTPPIILLQSDEGPFPMKTPLPPKQSWGKASDESLHEKFPILNAYYMPGASQEQLYQSITPVNSFRVIFNAYFDTKLPLLPDRSYVFQDQDNFYKFIDITDRLN